jgi:ParB-like chromosome segregation protein Spo0J
VYRVGGCHFVEDGHHRVSIARAARQESIDAYVTEVLTAAPAVAGAENAVPGPAGARGAAPGVRSG